MRGLALAVVVALASASASASASALEKELTSRVEAKLAEAEAALARGDGDAAAGALAAAWIYVGPMFEWDSGELGERVRVAERQVASLRRYPALTGARALARASLTEAAAQTRMIPGPFARAGEAARACMAAIDELGPEVDLAFAIQGESIAQVREECAAIENEAGLGQIAAAQAVIDRVGAIRLLVKGERLAVLDQYGEPECECADHAAAKVAKAREWSYRLGPKGALATYETLTFTFRGDKVIGKKQRIAHERP